MLERFLGLVEQARVLDRDHRLAREGLQQVDLALGEHARLGARHRDRAYDLALAQHRHRQHGAVAGEPGDVQGLVADAGIRVARRRC